MQLLMAAGFGYQAVMSTATRVQPITGSDKHVDREKTDGVLRHTWLTNNQDSALSVFTREADGTVRHFCTSHPWLDDDVNERGIDLAPVASGRACCRPGRYGAESQEDTSC